MGAARGGRVSWTVAAVVFALSACGGSGVATPVPDPGAIVMEGALGNHFVASGQASTVLSRLRIATHPLTNLARPAINLALVVDTSGSMDGRAIADARAVRR